MRIRFFIALAAIACTAQAQDFAMREYCQATPQEREVADATAMMLPNAYVNDNGDGTYSITSSPFFNEPALPPPGNICPDEPFYSQPQAPLGRTAFLVDTDRMVTAPHATRDFFDPKDYTIVFGLRLDKTSQTGCGTIDPAHIPEENVYRLGDDSYLYSSFVANQPHTSDYLYFKLPRQGPKVKPLALRRTGAPDIGDPLLVIGHPDYMLPVKVDTGASIKALSPAGLTIAGSVVILGSSGSPVYNVRKHVVETVIAEANVGVNWSLDAPRSCYLLRPIDGMASSNVNNGPLAPFVGHVDPSPRETQVWPLSTVRHERLPNGEITNATTSFTVARSPFAGPTPQTFQIVPSQNLLEAGVTVGTTLSADGGASPITLAAGDPPRTINVLASAAPGTCGVHETDIRVLLPGNKTERLITHRFELGMSDFTVTPNAAWSITKLLAPFPTRTITVTNRGPIGATYNVTSTKPWLTINGNASAAVSLSPAGAAGASTTITLGFAANAGSTVAIGATETAIVNVAAANADCSLRPAESIPVTFTNGIQSYDGTAATDEGFPQPVGGALFGSIVEIPVEISTEGPFTVADVNLDIGFDVEGQTNWRADQVDTHLRAWLVAPDGTSALLWDRNDTTPAYVTNATAANTQLSILRLDDTATPPLGPQTLGTFNGHQGNGLWKIRLQATTGSFNAFPFWARLTMKRTAAGATMTVAGISSGFDTLPAPASGQTFGAPIEMPFDLGSAAPFTVADVNLTVDFDLEAPFYPVPQADTLIKLELIAPDLTTAVLWDRNDSTAAYQSTETIFYPYDNYLLAASALSLDDTGKPPLGPNPLSTFNGHAGKGVWKLKIYGANNGWNVVPLMARIVVTPTP